MCDGCCYTAVKSLTASCAMATAVQLSSYLLLPVPWPLLYSCQRHSLLPVQWPLLYSCQSLTAPCAMATAVQLSVTHCALCNGHCCTAVRVTHCSMCCGHCYAAVSHLLFHVQWPRLIAVKSLTAPGAMATAVQLSQTLTASCAMATPVQLSVNISHSLFLVQYDHCCTAVKSLIIPCEMSTAEQLSINLRHSLFLV